MARKAKTARAAVPTEVSALARVLDQYEGRYRELRGVTSFGGYMTAAGKVADEEKLTEPLLGSLLEDVLGFGKGDYFPQLTKSGLKPDFTPTDLVTHRFVLDAKGSSESLPAHVAQIRRYVEQRALRYGVLFNGKHMRVYPSGSTAFDRSLSFDLLPLWRASRGEQLPVGPDFDAFAAFLKSFSHRTLSSAEKIERIRREESWTERLVEAVVDVEFLVEQLRQLADDLARDAGGHLQELHAYVEMSSDRAERLNDELRLLALDIEPGIDIDSLPTTIEAWSSGTGTVERVWRQYLLRVAYLSVTRILLYRAWEDVGFVDEMLYDGGFDDAYERLDESVREVLTRAFLLGSGKYKTLFHAETTTSGTGPARTFWSTCCTDSARYRSASSIRTSSALFTCRMSTRSIAIAWASSSRRATWCGSCSTAPGSAGRTSSASRVTTGFPYACSTSQPAPAVFSWKRRAQDHRRRWHRPRR